MKTIQGLNTATTTATNQTRRLRSDHIGKYNNIDYTTRQIQEQQNLDYSNTVYITGQCKGQQRFDYTQVYNYNGYTTTQRKQSNSTTYTKESSDNLQNRTKQRRTSTCYNGKRNRKEFDFTLRTTSKGLVNKYRQGISGWSICVVPLFGICIV